MGECQAFQVLLTLVRTKVVALLLGVDGVGLLGLLNNTISMVQSITGLGINQGGVKSISAAGQSPEGGTNSFFGETNEFVCRTIRFSSDINSFPMVITVELR